MLQHASCIFFLSVLWSVACRRVLRSFTGIRFMVQVLVVCSCLRTRALANLGHWRVFSSSVLWLEASVGLDHSLTCYFSLAIMADAQVGRRRRVANAEDGEHARSVRARMTEAEGRLDTVESTLGRHETQVAVY